MEWALSACLIILSPMKTTKIPCIFPDKQGIQRIVIGGLQPPSAFVRRIYLCGLRLGKPSAGGLETIEHGAQKNISRCRTCIARGFAKCFDGQSGGACRMGKYHTARA